MAELTIQETFDLALQHQQAGRLRHAEQLYRQILAQEPAHVNALHLLGVIAFQVGRYDVAVDLISQAINLKPNDADAHSNLGMALAGNGQLDQAIASYHRAIDLRPSFSEAHSHLANVLRLKGLLQESIVACQKAITLKPTNPEAHNNLGNALGDQAHLDEAIAAYRQAIALRPNFAEAYGNLGGVLRDKRQFDDAIAACRQAIELRPDYPEAHNNLANALRDKGQLDDAIAAYRRAVALRFNFREAHSNLGSALRNKGQLDLAVESYRQAIALKPNLAEAHGNLANALKDKGQLDDAIAAYRHALTLSPDNASIDSNLICTLCYHPDCDARNIAAENCRWNLQHAQPLQKFIQPHVNDRRPDRRLRIGYVSCDFRAHAVAFFLAPIFDHHDHSRFEIYCYANVTRPDAITDRFQSQADHWRHIVGMNDEQVANQIRADAIDILVDLSGHTAANRLLVFARKPAPVQVTWLGYPGSTGMTAIDYRLSDPYLDPPGMDESVYSEKNIRLPDSFWCYDPMRGREIAVSALPALANGWVTFGCLNNFCKINEPLLRLWATVLRSVPKSRLLLLAPEGNHRQHAIQVLNLENIDSERIEFETSRQPTLDYLRLYNRIDIGLDPTPYNGHTTSLDSLWMGVPVVNLAGPTAVGRVGASQLTNLGLSDLIAQTPERFVEIATELANDLGQVKNLRSTLRQRMQQSPLMDGPRFTRNIEAAYRKMWHKWCGSDGDCRDPGD